MKSNPYTSENESSSFTCVIFKGSDAPAVAPAINVRGFGVADRPEPEGNTTLISKAPRGRCDNLTSISNNPPSSINRPGAALKGLLACLNRICACSGSAILTVVFATLKPSYSIAPPDCVTA